MTSKPSLFLFLCLLACSEEVHLPDFKPECRASREESSFNTYAFFYDTKSNLREVRFETKPGVLSNLTYKFEYGPSTVRLYETYPPDQGKDLIKEFYFKNGRLTKIKSFESSSVTTESFHYGKDQTITLVLKSYDLQGNRLDAYDSSLWELDAKGNIITQHIFDHHRKIEYVLNRAYDEGNNPKKGNLFSFLLTGSHDWYVRYFNANNTISMEDLTYPSLPLKYTYSNEYNSQNFLVSTVHSQDYHSRINYSYENCY